VTVQVTLDKMDDRKLTFSIVGYDNIDKISEGTHERFIIDAAKFSAKTNAKLSRVNSGIGTDIIG